MMKKMILAMATVAVAAMSAKAQDLYAQAGDPVAISSLTDANAQGGVSYEWYRNGSLIPGCNGASCVVPANLATGTNVTFQRRAIALGCAIGNTSNAPAITITFCNVVRNGVCWGDVNVDGWRTLASKADVSTAFYQFNRTKAWAASGNVTGWVTSINQNANWHVDSSPCPDGWRLPTNEEYSSLDANSNPVGGVWAAANSSKGNSVSGRFYGKGAADCSLPNNMVGCVFFPAPGYRNASGTMTSTNIYGGLWSSRQVNNTNGANLYFYNSSSTIGNLSKAYGFNIRCVR